jgi:hypothetical protein
VAWVRVRVRVRGRVVVSARSVTHLKLGLALVPYVFSAGPGRTWRRPVGSSASRVAAGGVGWTGSGRRGLGYFTSSPSAGAPSRRCKPAADGLTGCSVPVSAVRDSPTCLEPLRQPFPSPSPDDHNALTTYPFRLPPGLGHRLRPVPRRCDQRRKALAGLEIRRCPLRPAAHTGEHPLRAQVQVHSQARGDSVSSGAFVETSPRRRRDLLTPA